MRSLAEARLAPPVVDCFLHGEEGVLNAADARGPLVLNRDSVRSRRLACPLFGEGRDSATTATWRE